MWDFDLGLEVLGVVVTGAEGADGSLPLMTDGRVGWVEGWDRSSDPIVTESTGVGLSESEYCLPRVGWEMGLSRSVMCEGG